MVIDRTNIAEHHPAKSRESASQPVQDSPDSHPVAILMKDAPWLKDYKGVEKLFACFARMYGPQMKQACLLDLYAPLDQKRLTETLAHFEREFPGDVIIGPGERANLLRLYRAALREIADRLKVVPPISQKTRFRFIVTVATMVDGIRRAAAHP